MIAPAPKDDEIDTPDDEMNDVRGERRGGWDTVEHIPFEEVKQDFDVDNTNPLSEINVKFFGFEDVALINTDFPSILDIPGMPYNDYVRAVVCNKMVEQFRRCGSSFGKRS